MADFIVEDKVKDIASYLYDNKSDKIGLFSGIGGCIMFYYHYNKVFDDYNYKGYEYELLEYVFDLINSNNIINYSFCDGLSGIGWLMCYLHENGDLSEDDFIISDDFDCYLYDKMMSLLMLNNYDYLHGASGIAYYFVKKKRIDYLKKFVAEIRIMAIYDSCCCKWKNSIISDDCSIGLAHGMSSLIVVLSKIYELGLSECKSIINYGIRYIISQQYRYDNVSLYPSKSLDLEIVGSYSRMGWCYGDLGVALAILNASKVLNDRCLYNHFLEIIQYSSKRLDLNKNFIYDACVCHGTSGIATLYKFYYQYTGNKYFYEIWKYWIEKTMNFSVEEKNNRPGYKFYIGPDGLSNRIECCNLLQGVCGVGLSLLSVVNPSIYWEEIILI